LASILVVLFAASAAPSPFFVLYKQEWGFPSWLLSFAFAIYAVTLLLALLTIGSLSDHVGRRPVLVGAIALQVIAMALFAFAPNIETVVIARAIQGVATGAATGALSAALTDLAPAGNRGLGAIVGSLAPFGGLAVGAILAGVVIDAVPNPVVATFVSFMILFLVALVVVVISPESVSKRPGAVRSLIPRIAVPPRARREFRSGIPIYLAGWMTGGLFLGLVPEILRDTFKIDSGLVSGAVIAVLSGIGTLAVFLSRRVRPRAVIVVGALSLVAGIALVALSLLFGEFMLFGVGTVVAGFGFGMTFAGEVRATAPLAEAHERGEMFAAIYVVSYLSFGVPAIIAGLAVAEFNLVPTSIVYAVIVVVSAAVGVVVQLRHARVR
jgi:MFS family permease